MYLFCILNAEEAFTNNIPEIKSCILICEKEYWEKNHFLSDSHISRRLREICGKLPISEEMESIFSSDKSQEEIKLILENAGLQPSNTLQKFGEQHKPYP